MCEYALEFGGILRNNILSTQEGVKPEVSSTKPLGSIWGCTINTRSSVPISSKPAFKETAAAQESHGAYPNVGLTSVGDFFSVWLCCSQQTGVLVFRYPYSGGLEFQLEPEADNRGMVSPKRWEVKFLSSGLALS